MTATDNRSLIERIMEARSRRDHAPFIAAMADDFVWRISGAALGRANMSVKPTFVNAC
jgi:ketosteroid isomerase-like protein